MSTKSVPFQQLVEYAPAGIFHSDAKGLICYANEHWLNLLGLSKRKTDPFDWFHAIDDHQLTAFKNEWHSCIEAHESFHYETKLKPQNGLTRYIRIDANPIIQDTQLTGYVGHIKDITLRTK